MVVECFKTQKHSPSPHIGPKAICPSFNDNKTYVVMFLTILFN